MPRAAVLPLTLALLGCNAEGPGGSGGSASGGGGPSECVEISQTSIFRLQAGADSGWFTETISAGYSPQIAEGWSSLSMKLRAEGTGTFDLAAEPDDTDTCERCVYVTWAGSGDHFQLALASAGTLELTDLDIDTGEARGTLRDVTFRQLGEVALHSFRGDHPDGTCVHIAEAQFDTFAAPGAPCERQGDCANGKLQVCDPATLTCALAQCTTESPACPDTDLCQIQQPLYGIGACHDSCAPFTDGACDGGRDCVPIDYVGAQGVCRAPTAEPPAPYEPCTPGHATTGCGPGHVCTTDAVYWHNSLCYPQCDFFGADPGCEGRCRIVGHDQKDIEASWLCGVGDCHMGGYCEREWDGAGILYGMPCTDLDEFWPCEGSDARLGVCLDTGGGLVCHQHCRLGGNDCDSGTCEPFIVSPGTDTERAIPGVGVCVQ